MRITSTAAFGEAIRARRKEQHYTQRFLSEFSGLSVSFISDLENGKKTAELEKAIFLANLLGMDLCMERRPGTDEREMQRKTKEEGKDKCFSVLRWK